MAKINLGILGGYSGRVGTVVGYYRMGKWCVRAYQPTINDAKSAAQLQQRSLFKAMIQFASRNKAAIRLGMKQMANKRGMTECNLFLHENSRCFAHVDGQVRIDHARLQFSSGSLPNVTFRQLDVDGSGRVEVGFDTNRVSQPARMEDEVHIVAVLAATGEEALCAPVARRSKRAAFVLPDGWASQEVHFYGFTLSADGTASGTAYLGTTPAPRMEKSAEKDSENHIYHIVNEQERETDTIPRPHRGESAGGVAADGEP